MEQHHIKQNKTNLLRNIGHFAYLQRPIEKPQKEEFHFPIRDLRLLLPPLITFEPDRSVGTDPPRQFFGVAYAGEI